MKYIIQNGNRGWTLIGMMIIILSISVLSIALWNSFSEESASWNLMTPAISVDRNIQSALDNISFQVKRAINMDGGIDDCCRIGYAFGKDTLAVKAGEINFKFFIDGDKNLIRQYDNSAIILASGIESFQLLKIDDENLMISITSISNSLFETAPGHTKPRSFGAVVKLRPTADAVNAAF